MNKTTVFDVVKYILEKSGAISAMKLQKLVYYAQAWSLVWDEVPLFEENIEAWANGPVVRELYNQHRGMFSVDADHFKTLAKHELSKIQKETIDAVLHAYGSKSARWLSDQTHIEQPWIIARQGLSDNERGERIISLESMAEYYGALL